MTGLLPAVLLLLLPPCSPLLDSEPVRVARLFQQEEGILSLLHQLGFSSSQEAQSLVSQGDAQAVAYLTAWRSRQQELGPGAPVEELLRLLVGNPVHVYCLVDRLVTLPSLLAALQEQVAAEQAALAWGQLARQEHLTKRLEIVEALARSVEVMALPGQQDLGAAGQALARVAYAYRLDPVDLAWGYILGHQTGARLTVGQMLQVARGRYEGLHPLRSGLGREWALAWEWGEAVLARLRREGGWGAGEVEVFLREVQAGHDTYWQSPVGKRGVLPSEEYFVAKLVGAQGPGPDGRRGRALRRLEVEHLAREPWQEDLPQGYSTHDFYALCRGEQPSRNRSVADPHCYLRDKGHPFWRLAPLREEVVSLSPPLLLYHDMLTEQEMTYMTEKVTNQLAVATVQDLTNDRGKVSVERSQSSGWLWDHDHPLLYKLARKTAALTGLNVASWLDAEAWQMGLYGPGGHYLPHFDAFDVLDGHAWADSNPKTWRGNRMATVMYYLSDLVGGATAFPTLGVAARPRRGTAVFWYNMREDGQRIPESLHGACPTALGVKWVSNKWIREGSQLWKRPCLKEKQ